MVARVYSLIFRAVPELIVIFLCFFVLPRFGLKFDPVTAVIISFVLVRTAYDYELFKGTLNGIEQAQIDACRALGIPLWSMIWRIVIPQVVRIAAGPWVTLAVGALKGLSLASAIGVSEIVFVARQGIILTGEPFQFIATAAFLYGIISAVMMAGAIILERRADYLRPS